MPPTDIPPFQAYHPAIDQLNAAQRSFYDRLRQSLDAGRRLDVAGNISYLFLYTYSLLESWNQAGYRQVHDRLILLGSLYPDEHKFAEGCRIWSLDCLLGLQNYDLYLQSTELSDPAEIFRKATHLSNLRCNVSKLANRPASPDDLVRMSDFRASKKTKSHPAEFRRHLHSFFSQEAERNGPWLERCLRMTPLTPVETYLFSGAPIRQPKAPFTIFPFYSVGPFLKEIETAAKAAQKILSQRTK